MTGLIKSTAVRIPKPINADGLRLIICMNQQMAELGLCSRREAAVWLDSFFR